MNKIGILQGRLTPEKGRGIQFFPTEEWKNEFEIAKKIGFECIELLVKADNYKENPLFTETEEIISLSRENNILVPSVHAFYKKTSEYPNVMATLVEKAHSVGAGTILVSFFKDNILKNEADKELARSQLKKALVVAEKLGSKIAIEAEMVIEELKEFVESFGSKNIGVYYDIGNMASMGVDVANEIVILKELIFGVHIKDREQNTGPSVPIGEGCADFFSILSVLRDNGYDGALIIQGARDTEVDDISLNKRYLSYIKDLMNKIYG